jgi:ankyrin repeat protein
MDDVRKVLKNRAQLEAELACHGTFSVSPGALSEARDDNPLERLPSRMQYAFDCDAFDSEHDTSEANEALIAAIQANSMPAMVQAIEDGASVAGALDADGSTALHYAALEGELPLLDWLVNHGADLTAVDKLGCTALHLAGQDGTVPVLELLVEHGADITAVDIDHATALHFASANGHIAAMEWLVTHGADLTAVVKTGRTALFSAALNGQVEAMEWLVGQGVDVAAPDEDGHTALFCARRWGQKGSVEWLLIHQLESSEAAIKSLLLADEPGSAATGGAGAGAAGGRKKKNKGRKGKAKEKEEKGEEKEKGEKGLGEGIEEGIEAKIRREKLPSQKASILGAQFGEATVGGGIALIPEMLEALGVTEEGISKMPDANFEADVSAIAATGSPVGGQGEAERTLEGQGAKGKGKAERKGTEKSENACAVTGRKKGGGASKEAESLKEMALISKYADGIGIWTESVPPAASSSFEARLKVMRDATRAAEVPIETWLEIGKEIPGLDMYFGRGDGEAGWRQRINILQVMTEEELEESHRFTETAFEVMIPPPPSAKNTDVLKDEKRREAMGFMVTYAKHCLDQKKRERWVCVCVYCMRSECVSVFIA